MLKFRLKGGPHCEDDKTYKPGDIIETDRELDKIFARAKKFERIGSHSSPSNNAGGGDTGALPTSKYGTDVTSIAHGYLLKGTLRVFQKGQWFNVVDMESGTRLNDKAIRKPKLDEFLKQYIEKADTLIATLDSEAQEGGE